MNVHNIPLVVKEYELLNEYKKILNVWYKDYSVQVNDMVVVEEVYRTGDMKEL